MSTLVERRFVVNKFGISLIKEMPRRMSSIAMITDIISAGIIAYNGFESNVVMQYVSDPIPVTAKKIF